MLTSKQRAKLKGMANTIDTILQVGKDGIGEQLIIQVRDALTARELIKISVHETAPCTPQEAAEELAQAIKCEVVQVIGRKIVFYKRNGKKPKIELGKL